MERTKRHRNDYLSSYELPRYHTITITYVGGRTVRVERKGHWLLIHYFVHPAGWGPTSIHVDLGVLACARIKRFLTRSISRLKALARQEEQKSDVDLV
jgi:hypothetical protein